MRINILLLEKLQIQEQTTIKNGEVILLQTDFITNLFNINNIYTTANIDNDNWDPYVIIETNHIEGQYYLCKLIPETTIGKNSWPFNAIEIIISEDGKTKPYVLDLNNRIIINEFNIKYIFQNKVVFFSCLDKKQENRLENELRSIILRNWTELQTSKIITKLYQKINNQKNHLKINWIDDEKFQNDGKEKTKDEKTKTKQKNIKKKLQTILNTEQATINIKKRQFQPKLSASVEFKTKKSKAVKRELQTILDQTKKQYSKKQLFKTFKKYIDNTAKDKNSTSFKEFLKTKNTDQWLEANQKHFETEKTTINNFAEKEKKPIICLKRKILEIEKQKSKKMKMST